MFSRHTPHGSPSYSLRLVLVVAAPVLAMERRSSMRHASAAMNTVNGLGVGLDGCEVDRVEDSLPHKDHVLADDVVVAKIGARTRVDLFHLGVANHYFVDKVGVALDIKAGAALLVLA